MYEDNVCNNENITDETIFSVQYFSDIGRMRIFGLVSKRFIEKSIYRYFKFFFAITI